MALKDTWLDRTTEDYVSPKTVNELAAAIIEIEKNGAGVIPTISVEEVNNGYVFIVDDGKGNVERVKVENGTAPYIGEDGYWYIGLSNTGIIADASKALEDLDTAVATEDIKGGFMPMGGNAYNVAYGGEETIKLEIKAATSIDDLLTTYVDLVFPEGNWDIHVKHTGNLPVPIVFDIEGVKIYTDCTNLPSNSIREMIGKTDYFSDESIRIVFSVINRGDACSFDLYCVNHIEGKDGLMSSEDKGALTDLRSKVDQINSALPKDSKGNYKEVAAKEDAENLSTQLLANTLKGSASGTIVSMKDVSPIEHEMGVRARGTNKFYLNETKTRTAGGLSFNLTQGQSSFIVNGTSTASSSAKLTEIPLKAGTYTVAIYGANAITTDMDRIFLQYNTNGSTTTINNIMDGNTKTFTLPYDVTVTVSFVFAGASTYENKEIRIQIEEGSVATAYAPYVPNITQTKILKQGKNLLDIDSMLNDSLTKNGEEYTFARTDSTWNGRASKLMNIFIPANTPITFSVGTSVYYGTKNSAIAIQFTFDDNSLETNFVLSPDKLSRTKTFEKNILKARLYLNNEEAIGTPITVFTKPMLEIGSTATEPELYIDPVEYAVSTDGTVNGVKSIHPSTTLYSDTSGVVIDVDYNRDINIAFQQLEEKITALSAAMI